jgi:hypothetical protein
MSRAKFDLSNDAPVKLGDHKSFATEIPMFTPDEYERGGRQIAPNLIEFYPPTNAISLRVDVWLEEARTQERVGSLVFRGSLDLTGPRVDIWTFEEPYPMVVPSGEYDAEIRLVNEGTHDDDLRDRERFDRDDLERCEIYLTPRSV